MLAAAKTSADALLFFYISGDKETHKCFAYRAKLFAELIVFSLVTEISG